MAVEIRMPKMGLSMKTGTVSKWIIEEGEKVKKGEIVLEIMTDKITNTVESPVDGIVLKVVVPEGEEGAVGDLLGVIGQEGEVVHHTSSPQENVIVPRDGQVYEAEPAKTASLSAEMLREKIKISPSARKFATANGIDYTLIAGTGPGGRITRDDIEQAAQAKHDVFSNNTEPVTDIVENVETIAEADSLPYSGMRKAIGEHMVRSWTTAPKVTHHVSVDVSELLGLRAKLNESLTGEDRISITDLLIKLVGKALTMRPRMNAALEQNQIKILHHVHIGVAVALDEGLVVPVIRHVDDKSPSYIHGELKALVKKAREHRLEPDDLKGGTFTITNLGTYQSVDWFTPILNQPESAILGIGRIMEAPVVVDSQIVIRPMMGLSLAFDHRVIDGAPAAEFLSVILKLIQKPFQILV